MRRPAVYGRVDDLQCTAEWTTFSVRQRTGVSMGVMEENQSSGYTLRLTLPFDVFPLCTRTRLVRDLMLHHLSGTVSLAKLNRQTHSHLSTHLSNLTSSSHPNYCVYVRACVRVCVCGGGGGGGEGGACVRVCLKYIQFHTSDCLCIKCLKYIENFIPLTVCVLTV